MDAFKFVNELYRMCKSQNDCECCELNDIGCNIRLIDNVIDRHKLAEIVEHWSNTHVAQTWQSEFLKLYPNAKIADDGYIDICPNVIAEDVPCLFNKISCNDCRKLFWTSEK